MDYLWKIYLLGILAVAITGWKQIKDNKEI